MKGALPPSHAPALAGGPSIDASYGRLTATLPVQMYSAMGEGYLQISSALAMLLLVPSVLLSYLIARYLRVENAAAG